MDANMIQVLEMDEKVSLAQLREVLMEAEEDMLLTKL